MHLPLDDLFGAQDPGEWSDALRALGLADQVVEFYTGEWRTALEDMEATMAGHPPRPLAPAPLAFVLEAYNYAAFVLGEVQAPSGREDESITTAAGRPSGVSAGRFIHMPPMARLSLRKMPPTWNLLERRIQWTYTMEIDGGLNGSAKGSEDLDRARARLAESARLNRMAYTDSLAAIVWLQFFAVVERGMTLRPCSARGCKAVFIAQDNRSLFCAVHSAPPEASANDVAAYERIRRRDQEATNGRRVRTWEDWWAKRRPRR